MTTSCSGTDLGFEFEPASQETLFPDKMFMASLENDDMDWDKPLVLLSSSDTVEPEYSNKMGLIVLLCTVALIVEILIYQFMF